MVEIFVQHMQYELEISLAGELAYFLYFQVMQMKDDIFNSLSMYPRNRVEILG